MGESHYVNERAGRLIDAGVLTLAIALGITLRVHFLYQPIKYDEALTFTFATQPLSQSLSEGYFPNNHLLHTLLAHASMKCFGQSEWSLRVPAFVAGVMMIPATWLMARRLFGGTGAALAAAMLVAVSSALVDYSTNARGYTIVALIFLIMLTVADVIMRETLTRRAQWCAWATMAILAALGFYAIPVMLYPFGAVAVWMGLHALRRRPAMRIPLIASTAAAALLILLLYAPVFQRSGMEAVAGNKFVRSLSWADVLARLPGMARDTWLLWMRDMPAAIVGALVIGVVASLVLNRRDPVGRAHPLIVAVAWCALAVAVQRVVPYPRVWLFLLPLVFASAAAGIEVLLRLPVVPRYEHGAVVAGPLLVLVIGAWLGWQTYAAESPTYSEETGTLPAAPRIARDLAARVRPGHRLVAHVPASAPMRFYCRRNRIPGAMWLPRPDAPPHPILWVIVREPTQTLEFVLRAQRVTTEPYGPPRKVREYAGASLYRLVLRDDAGATTGPVPITPEEPPAPRW
ncbi:MAG: glycosyltransferase family 39 protein [Tepidisphaeraceae bacterium]